MNSNIKHHPLLSLSSLLSFFTLELLVAGYLSPSSLQKHQHHPVFQHSSLMSVSLEEKEIQEEIYDFTSHGQTIYLLKPRNVEDPNCKCVSCIEQTFTIKKTDNVETSFHPQKKKTKGRMYNISYMKDTKLVFQDIIFLVNLLANTILWCTMEKVTLLLTKRKGQRGAENKWEGVRVLRQDIYIYI